MKNPDELLNFWFADACSSPAAALARNEFWFRPDPATDEYIWENFGDAVEDAAAGHYDHWLKNSRGRLALIVLLDQFPRNIYRGTSEVFRYDARAFEMASGGVRLGQLAGLTVPEQAFFLMPYQHIEDFEAQNEGVELLHGVVDNAPGDWRDVAVNYYNYARRHRDIVAEYGRFPHRNVLLGRSSTATEERFLAEAGETFGQGG